MMRFETAGLEESNYGKGKGAYEYGNLLSD